MAYKNKSDAFAYNNRFNKEKYDRINLTVPKDKKELIQEAARQQGESVNVFIRRVVQAELDRLGIGSERAGR